MAHPSFPSLPGGYVLLGEQRGMWICVGPGRSRELPECSSLFGVRAEYEMLAFEAVEPRQRLVVGQGIVLVFGMGSQPTLTTLGQRVLP